MAKYHSGVSWPSKTIRLSNPQAKFTSRQTKFAVRVANIAGRALNVKNK